MANVPPITALTVTSAVLIGVVFALLGNLKLAFARRPDQAEHTLSRLLSLLNLLIIPLVLLAGVFVDLWGARPMTIVGSVLLTLSFLGLSARPAYSRVLLAVGTAALGAAALWVATVVLFPAGLFGPHELAASVGFGLVFMALGALISPPLFDLLQATLGFRRTMAVFALLLLLPAFLAALPRPEEFPRTGHIDNLLTPLRQPVVWMAALVFFVYAPLEAFVTVWTTTFLGNHSQQQRQSWWLASFWSSLLLSRVLFAILQHSTSIGDIGGGWFLVLPALLAAVALGNMAGTTRPTNSLWGLIVLGFALGPLFPVLVGLLFQNRSVSHAPGTTFAVLHAAGSLGSFILAPLVNLSAGDRNIHTALRIPLFIALVLTAVTLLFVLLSGAG